MLSAQRREHLLALLAAEGRVVAKSVAAELGISEDSIRRDLRELAEAGLCIRVYGGALPVPLADAPVQRRLGVAVDSKHRVAQAAAALIRPGMTVILDAGTTALAMAAMLPDDITLITPSPAVAVAALDSTKARVVMIGGELSRHSAVAGGGLAHEAIARIAADAFFLGVTGIHPDHGLTTGELDDAVTKRALAARSADTYVLGSAEKIGAASRFPVVGLDEITGIVVDPHDQNPLIAQLPTA
ncbi:DeoR/GlpR transcriptional regulator [Microbacterium esteraromaticum]|uniref:Lactose phosphotransferase system repressor n=1 Tax=Microbacterium esteraromaticum TaxID=57043 RepID=A0A7D7WFK3_9MICO|nr:DeoR/GlpR family DNA-binding transcription regulator [Microbacterium esteraromaticum]QMU96093.1 DeoR/GlpR transcriptional regulator [Microbacterium esteraromaticum]